MAPAALTPLALEHAPLMRRLAAQDFTSKTELAAALGRDLSNLNKTLKALAGEGLVTPTAAQLTDAGANAVRELDQLDGRVGQGRAAADRSELGLPAGYIALRHSQIAPDPLNPRKHFDPEAVLELAASIARDGLLENLVVRPALPGETSHRLVAGERRWRAMSVLIEDGRWAADATIVCKVVDIDDAAHRRIALIENLQRKDLRPVDEAMALDELMKVTGKGTAEVAEEIGFTQRFVQQRLQLLELPPEIRGRLNAGELTVEKGRAAASIWPKLPPIKKVELREGKITVEAAQKWLADQAEEVELPDEQLLILAEVAWAIAAKPSNHWADTPCDYRHAGLPTQMEKDGLLVFTSSYYGADEGMPRVRLAHKAFQQLQRRCGADAQLTRTALEPLLRQVRVKVIGGNPLSGPYRPDAHKDVDRLFKDKRYHTPWLNKPFEMDPAVKEKLEKKKAEEAERNREWRERDAREKAARDAKLAAGREALVGATALCAALAAAEPEPLCGAELAALLAQTNRPLPWTCSATGALLDGNGLVIIQGHWNDPDPAMLARHRLIAAAMNRAAGVAFAPPDAAPDAPPPLTRDAYVARIAGGLLDSDSAFPSRDRAETVAIVNRALDQLLQRAGVAFGDPGEDWDLIEDDVVQLAYDLAESDDQVDLEDAIASRSDCD